MKIVLLGYGRMGQDIEKVAVERGHAIAARFTIDDPLPELTKLSPEVKSADCAIDFSSPDATAHHIHTLGPLHVPLVVGTTGWNDQLASHVKFIRECGGTLLHASNFSVGAYILFHLAAEASKLVDRFPEYDAAIHETHHRLKKDAPSGTALHLAKKVLMALKRKTEIVTSLNNRAIEPHELLVSSSRIGSVAGTHTLTFESDADAIEITHTAHTRRGFALGAVAGAEWVRGKTGVFTIEDFVLNK
ncbi:MAG TPA: 4-hydroxy-tetrahydrodipicolinate reductase [Bacteroidota bacterium]|nr:4-hydroxy-tetrahydrodipicolinate reductase [Bacteroidota bacterium]